MKLILLSLALIICFQLSAQKEGQEFCSEYESKNYFPLSISKKKLHWYNAFYFEKVIGKKKINGKEYIEYSQNWKDGDIDSLFLREENGIVYQYEECCNSETVRFNSKFKKGNTWKTADEKTTYTIESLNGTLETPYCNYKNLLVIKGEFIGVTYNFYYKKGYGYVGATNINNDLISWVSPEW